MLLRLIFSLVSMWDDESIFHREGMEIKYERLTVKEKKAACMKPATYKAPESV